ncbi:MAG: protein translocase subunit SecF [archaeon]
MFDKVKKFYEEKYRILMVITMLFVLFSIGTLAYSKVTTGEFIKKDVSLKGGLLVTVSTDRTYNPTELAKSIGLDLGVSVNARGLGSVSGQNIGYTIEIEKLSNSSTAIPAIEKAMGITLGAKDYTIEESSSALGESFFSSTLETIGLAFLFMSIVVFFYFRQPIPALAVILAGASDLIGTFAIMNLAGIRLSTAGVAALLMLIGFSVDSDILLSARVLKRTEGTVMDRVYSSVKTGLTMQTTAIVALAVMWIVTPAELLKQIAMILIIGLVLDIFNTWVQNVGILRAYMENREKQSGMFSAGFTKVKHG